MNFVFVFCFPALYKERSGENIQTIILPVGCMICTNMIIVKFESIATVKVSMMVFEL
jgi:hypothetical protein